MKIVAEKDVTERDIVACMPCSSMPEPPVPSVLGECYECNAPIWIAISSPPRARRICVGCAAKLMRKSQGIQVAVTEKQIKDAEQAG